MAPRARAAKISQPARLLTPRQTTESSHTAATMEGGGEEGRPAPPPDPTQGLGRSELPLGVPSTRQLPATPREGGQFVVAVSVCLWASAALTRSRRAPAGPWKVRELATAGGGTGIGSRPFQARRPEPRAWGAAQTANSAGLAVAKGAPARV